MIHEGTTTWQRRLTFQIIPLLAQKHHPTPSSPFWPFALELELLVFLPVIFWLEPKHAYGEPGPFAVRSTTTSNVEFAISNRYGSNFMTSTLEHSCGVQTVMPIMADWRAQPPAANASEKLLRSPSRQASTVMTSNEKGLPPQHNRIASAERKPKIPHSLNQKQTMILLLSVWQHRQHKPTGIIWNTLDLLKQNKI